MASKSFIRGLLDDPEDPQLPQYNPQGGWDTAANFGRMAAGMTTPGAVADAAGLLGSPSLRENVSGGNYLDALLQGVGVIPGVGMLAKAGAGAKMAMAIPAATKVGKAAKAAETIAEAAPEGIIAYHGSPHSFDKFSLDKIGTGEGNQVYGHGLYFADNEDVAKSYRDALAGKDTIPAMNAEMSRLNKIMSQYETPGKWRQYSSPEGYEAAKRYDELMDARANEKGSMYQVRINADPEQFFNWDKPLSEQSQYIQDALKQLSNNPKNGFNLIDSIATLDAAKADPRLSHLTKRGSPVNPTGSSIYENLANERGAVDWPITADADIRKEYRNKASVLTSQDMRNAGIPGVKYLDQGSRSEGVGSHNYVVFDDKLIDVLKKYGLIGLLGGGAAAGISGQQQAQPGI